MCGLSLAGLFLFYGCKPYTPPLDTKNNIRTALIEKADRVGTYIAVAQQAENEGYSEVSVYLNGLAQQEMEHVRDLAVLQIDIERTTKRNITKILKLEKKAYMSEYPKMSRVATAEGRDDISQIFDYLAEDEERHYMGIKGLKIEKK